MTPLPEAHPSLPYQGYKCLPIKFSPPTRTLLTYHSLPDNTTVSLLKASCAHVGPNLPSNHPPVYICASSIICSQPLIQDVPVCLPVLALFCLLGLSGPHIFLCISKSDPQFKALAKYHNLLEAFFSTFLH